MNLQENIPYSSENPTTQHPRMNWLKFVIMIIIAVCLVGIGIFVGINISRTTDQNTSQPTSPTQPSAQPTVISLPTASSDKTTDWQTFRNGLYNFELKYPPEYTAVENMKEIEGFMATSKPKGAIQVVVEPTTGNSCRDGLCGVLAKNQLLINDINWDNLGSSEYCDAGMCSSATAVYRTVKDTNRFYIFFYDEDATEEILQTFQFGM